MLEALLPTEQVIDDDRQLISIQPEPPQTPQAGKLVLVQIFELQSRRSERTNKINLFADHGSVCRYVVLGTSHSADKLPHSYSIHVHSNARITVKIMREITVASSPRDVEVENDELRQRTCAKIMTIRRRALRKGRNELEEGFVCVSNFFSGFFTSRGIWGGMLGTVFYGRQMAGNRQFDCEFGPDIK